MTDLIPVQSPTLQHVIAVYSLVDVGREIVAKGELTPEDAVELRAMMDNADRVFRLCREDA